MDSKNNSFPPPEQMYESKQQSCKTKIVRKIRTNYLLVVVVVVVVAGSQTSPVFLGLLFVQENVLEERMMLMRMMEPFGKKTKLCCRWLVVCWFHELSSTRFTILERSRSIQNKRKWGIKRLGIKGGQSIRKWIID